ncbi:hypothetical protein cypCar_00033843 [Cyprinus carpio]|nr:hypothetical protein cypCar_00033843 [Cyprinus carpio]
MARVWLQLCLPLFLFTSTFCVDVSLIQVPANDGISGVLLVQTKNNVYSFNATTAREACEAIKMRIAKKAEVETANNNGFQTCRFGWVEEQIAVIPRIERSEKCGKNKLGISVWRADISKMFDVYCFKPAASPKTFVIISIVLLFLLAAAGAAWYLKIKRGQRFPSWDRMRPNEITETEMWKQISERHCTPKQTSKDKNKGICNIIFQMEQDPDSP